jgi:large subunit ribosomal protein L29
MKAIEQLSEIREQSSEELEHRVLRLREALFKSRMRQQTNQVENSMVPRMTRRELARVLTILHQRSLGLEAIPGASDAGGDVSDEEQVTQSRAGKASAKGAARGKGTHPSKSTRSHTHKAAAGAKKTAASKAKEPSGAKPSKTKAGKTAGQKSKGKK